MKLAVVAFPNLEDADRQWIELFRKKYDPQASRIEVHFTLVYPVESQLEIVTSEIALQARSTTPIAFKVRRVQVVQDPFGQGSHVFLVPDEGAIEISSLHDRLTTTKLKEHLRPDIPFAPHMTIATAPDSGSALRLAKELDLRGRTVRGIIEALELLDVSTLHVRSVATYRLAIRDISPTGNDAA